MKTLNKIHSIISAIVIILAFPSLAFAGQIEIGGKLMSDEFVEREGVRYYPLDKIIPDLGVSRIDNGTELILGNTINGTIKIQSGSHEFSGISGSFDFGYLLLRNGDSIFVPETFLEPGLGIKTIFSNDKTVARLYPYVWSITPNNGVIRINSSLKCEFTTFELNDPPRRVIDIQDAFLKGTSLSVNGNQFGYTILKNLRVSQFSIDPPVVRVVLEWSGSNTTGHTVYPDNSTISVLFSEIANAKNEYFGTNLLTGESQIEQKPDVDIPLGSRSGSQSRDVESEFLFSVNPTQTPRVNPPISDPILPIPDSKPTSPVSVEPKQQNDETLDIKPIEYPDEAVDWDLQKLGWTINIDAIGDHKDLHTKIKCPPFLALSDFTLGSDNGMRIVIDLLGSYIPGHERTAPGKNEIDKIRIGQFQQDITRIVLDTKKVVAYEIDYDRALGDIVVRFLSGDLSGKVIVIDPGHGGDDPGATVNGIFEKDLNLEMSFYLGDFLREQGAKVVYTRDTDVYITLADRLQVAINNNADLFIIVHNNATDNPTTMQGPLLLYNNPANMPLYRLAHRGMAARTGVAGLGPIEDQRGLYLLRNSKDLNVLFVEAAFLTNNIDFTRLTDPSRTYAKNLMLGVMDGVMAWFAHRDLPPVQYPILANELNIGIFDLAGKDVTASVDEITDSGSAWEGSDDSEVNADSETGSDGSESVEEETDKSEENEAKSDDKDEDLDKYRGRRRHR